MSVSGPGRNPDPARPNPASRLSPEIVDPWADTAPTAPASTPLAPGIVDPWAPGSPRYTPPLAPTPDRFAGSMTTVPNTAPVHAASMAALGQIAPKLQRGAMNNVSWTPKYAFQPGTSIDDLSQILLWASRVPGSPKVKAGGSRHSQTRVAATNGVYIHPEHMQFLKYVPGPGKPGSVLRKECSPAFAASLRQVGAGTTIRDINSMLWDQDRALPCLGGFDGQTIGGVLPTGTHGSVLKHGPLAEMVASIDMVKPDGTKVRVEPWNGAITDRAAFKAQNPDMELIQSDDVFNAALVNQGTMGVVHSYMLKTVPKFYMREVRTETNFKDTRKLLSNGNIYNLMQNDTRPPKTGTPGFPGQPRPSYHMELLFNPYSDKVIVTSRNYVEPGIQQVLAEEEPKSFRLPPSPRDEEPGDPPDQYTRPGRWATDTFGRTAVEINGWLARHNPSVLPGTIDLAMGGLADKEYTNRSYNVFNVGELVNQLPAQSAEISVPLRNDQYLRAMELMRATAARLATQGIYQSAPISVRFVKGTDAMLGDHEDVAKFEILFANDSPEAQALARKMVAEYYKDLHKELGPNVRMHWGQIIPEAVVPQIKADLRKSYPQYDKFDKIRREFDPQGRFMSDWQEKLLI